jgi:acetyl/propionyl-CoA carboxylase alpha subunit
VYAEEPEKGFLPSIGSISHFVQPEPSAHVRIDSGVEQHDEISPHYDPMIAKLIVWDETRGLAVHGMLKALSEFEIAGVGNNLGFLSRLIDHPAFRDGRIDTGLIERERDALLIPMAQDFSAAAEIAALWIIGDPCVPPWSALPPHGVRAVGSHRWGRAARREPSGAHARENSGTDRGDRPQYRERRTAARYGKL